MKLIFLILLLSVDINGYSHVYNCDKNYSIEIRDAHYSLAYTNVYTVTNRYIRVTRISGIEKEKDSILLKRNIDGKECSMILSFLEQHKFDQLKDSYSNPNVADGNRKKIEIRINKKTKTIMVANMYQKDIAELFSTINKLLNASLAIRYRHA